MGKVKGKNMTHFKLLAVVALALVLGACASQDIPDPEPTSTDAGSADSGASTDGYDDGTFGQGEEIPYSEAADELAMIIYFDFDQSEVRAGDQATLDECNRPLPNAATTAPVPSITRRSSFEPITIR